MTTLLLEYQFETARMKEITLSAMPPCFEKWCAKFDNLWKNQGQKKGFRYYLAGLLGESKRKNIAQMTDNIIGSSYHHPSRN